MSETRESYLRGFAAGYAWSLTEISRFKEALIEIAEESPDDCGHTDGRRIAIEALRGEHTKGLSKMTIDEFAEAVFQRRAKLSQ